MVELTNVRTRGEDWWTLGFEATAAHWRPPPRSVFAQPWRCGTQPDESTSYAQWLGQRPARRQLGGQQAPDTGAMIQKAVFNW